jgi:hypothetical protein
MITDQIMNINRILETHSHHEANKYLQEGWRLLNIYTITPSYEVNDQLNMYVLGKSEDLGHI